MSVNLDEIKNSYSFYAQMSQPKEFQYFKQTFEIIKDIVSDGTLIVNNTGMKITKMNTSGEALVYVKFEASGLTFYHCPEQLEIGLDFTSLQKRLRQIPNGDSTAFYVKKNSLTFGISCYMADKKKTLNYEILMNEPEKEEIKIPETVFKSVLVIASNEFKSICANALQIPHIDIEYTNQKLIFHGKGTDGQFYCVLDEIEHNDEEEEEEDESNKNDEKNYPTYQGRFDLELLTKFSKAASINDQMRMLLKNNNALVIQYNIGNMGCLRFCLGETDYEDDDDLDDVTMSNYHETSWGSQFNNNNI